MYMHAKFAHTVLPYWLLTSLVLQPSVDPEMISKMKSENSALRAEITALKAESSDLKSTKAQLSVEVESLKKALEKASQPYMCK